MGRRRSGGITFVPADEPWVSGLTDPVACKNCKAVIAHKVVPIWKPFYHLICPQCGNTAWTKQQEQVQA